MEISKKKYRYSFLKILIIIHFIFVFILIKVFQKFKTNHNLTIELKRANKRLINSINALNINISNRNCYLLFDNSNVRIIHLIMTRFLIRFIHKDGFQQNLDKANYIQNGIIVMKKYLLPSLENQSCKNFSWILILGNQVNITYIKTLANFNNSFETNIIYEKDIKNYIKNIIKDFHILITTRIDYDDIIYYDAVNDVRKEININRPMLLHGYNRGVIYFESDRKYKEFNYKSYQNQGIFGVFISLITVLNKVNDSYTIYDIGNHALLRKTLLENYKLYGINELNYEPAIIDKGAPKFVYVRQNFSVNYNKHIKWFTKGFKNNTNIEEFFGIKKI